MTKYYLLYGKKLRNIIVHSNELITLTVPELWPFSGNNYTNMLHVLNQRGLVKIEIMTIETSVEKKRKCGTYNSGFIFIIFCFIASATAKCFLWKGIVQVCYFTIIFIFLRPFPFAILTYCIHI